MTKKTHGQSRKISRRAFLAGGGALLVSAAGGGLLYRAADNGVFSVGDGAAYAPWSDFDTRTDTPVDLVRYAILASNAHNAQPWLFRVTEDQIDLYADTSRNIGAVDPHLRELYTSGGCALANLLIAAPALGYQVDYTVMPSADHTHLATVRLSRTDSVASPLLNVIPRRHTNRYAYEKDRGIPTTVLEEIGGCAQPFEAVQIAWVVAPDHKQSLGDLMIQATEAIIDDGMQSQASFAWQRQSWDDIQRYRDGITLDCAGQDEFTVVLGKVLSPVSRDQSDEYWLTSMRERQVPTAAVFGMICLHDLDKLSQRVQGGIVWQNVHLRLAAAGLAAQPLNQIPERIQREQATGIAPYFQKALAAFMDADQQALMLFRAGYPTDDPNRSPRRALEKVLLPT